MAAQDYTAGGFTAEFIAGTMKNMRLPDEHWMRQAIQLGETVRGKTGDNPHVGCVLVEKNRLLVKAGLILPGNITLKPMQFIKPRTWGWILAN